MDDYIRVKKTSKSGNIAGAIAGLLRTNEEAPPIAVIGSLATFIAVKSIAIATKFLEKDGIVPLVRVDMDKVEEDGAERSRLILRVKGERVER